MREYFKDTLQIMERALESMDAGSFDRLVEESVATIQGGKKIIASGLGKNVPICDKFVGSMVSMGLPAYFLHTNSAVHGDIGLVQEGDLVIVLTKSGETAESIYLTEHLKRHGANIWLLSFTRVSTLSGQIPNCLIMDLEHEGDLWNIMPNNSSVLNLVVLQGLAVSVAERLGLKLDDFRRNHPGGFIGEVLGGK